MGDNKLAIHSIFTYYSPMGDLTTHRVYMHFMHSNGWYCQFLERDLKTSLPRKLTFRDAAKIHEMHDRFCNERKQEDKQALEYAINMGRGSMWLNLTSEQYARLKRR